VPEATTTAGVLAKVMQKLLQRFVEVLGGVSSFFKARTMCRFSLSRRIKEKGDNSFLRRDNSFHFRK